MSETKPVQTAKLFTNGRSQAVRLPKAYRFEGTEVRIRKVDDGVLLQALETESWPRGYWERLEKLREDLDLEDLESPPDPPPAPLDFALDESSTCEKPES